MSVQRGALETAKRGLDIVGSGVGLAVLSPVVAVVAIAVRLKLGSPVVFTQDRPGRYGEVFTLLKFRSMLDVDETKGLVTNEQRMTRFGRLLRSTSLDELPSLLNVLRGDMSLVGPRPLRLDYVPRYSRQQARRHEVRPGVTGLAQVKGRNALSWDERFELDIEYVDSWSLRGDVWILLHTLLRVFERDNVEGDGMATMSAFVGNPPDDGLVERDLASEWLETRIDWLNHPDIRDGITIGFEPNLPDTLKWFESISRREDRRDWVYLNDNRDPVAMAGLSGVGTPDLTLYIYVNPMQHGRGYGRKVMDRLILRARSYGGHRLHLEVKATNNRASKLYERAGFLRTADLENPDVRKHAYVLDLRNEE